MNSENVKRYEPTPFKLVQEKDSGRFVTHSDYQALEEQLKEARAANEKVVTTLCVRKRVIEIELRSCELSGQEKQIVSAKRALREIEALLILIAPLDVAISPPQPEASAEKAMPSKEYRARAVYSKYTDNHPTIHSNRFPAWDELTYDEKRKWFKEASAEDGRAA